MYGVPDDLPVEMFIGAALEQVCIDPWDIQFRFIGPPEAPIFKTITVEGRWELRDVAGTIIDRGDRSIGNAQHETFRVQAILTSTVTAAYLNAPESFTLTFDDGEALTVYDDSEQYESFSIQPGNRFI
jgi:hypothetical protein